MNHELRIENREKGQALITLLVFVVMASVIITGAVAVTAINSQATTILSNSEEAWKVAEGGADNAVLRLLRNPNYTGETLTVGSGTATITVSGTTTKTIISEGVAGNFYRKVQAVGSYNNNIFIVSSWSEID